MFLLGELIPKYIHVRFDCLMKVIVALILNECSRNNYSYLVDCFYVNQWRRIKLNNYFLLLVRNFDRPVPEVEYPD